jgi:hypothetical protein
MRTSPPESSATAEVSARPPKRAPQESQPWHRLLGETRKFPGLDRFTGSHIRLLRVGQGSSCHFNRHSRNFLRAAPLRVLRFCCIRPQKEVSVQAQKRGRTGFDSSLEAQMACRGWFVGLVKNRTKNKRRQRRSRSRGLIDRDVCRGTPATAANVDSRLANRRSDHAGS